MAGGKKLSDNSPFLDLLRSVAPELRETFRVLVYAIDKFRHNVAKAVNYNAVKYFNQNAAPTTTDLLDGQLAVWKDADATPTNPTHYIVYNDAGTIRTFASVEVVP